jgi:RNA polymerase sigma-70 factor (ECF subfamily)
MGTICRNEIAMHFRRQSRRPWEVEWTQDAQDFDGPADSLATVRVDEQLIQEERAGLVHMVLDLLPSHYSNALEWKYLESLSVKEIAERLQMTPKAVESMLTRARLAFREQFDRHIDQLEIEAPSIPASSRRAVSES